ncbi:MAG: LCP family protein [Candidatus Metalachnospira sp.]|nr:LCP family protein [Candidatus Metalachnospira sp.]
MSEKNNNNYRDNHRRSRLIGRFFLTVTLIVFVFSAVFVLAATAYKSSADKEAALNGETGDQSDLKQTVADSKINMAVLGLDEDGIHSDVVFVVSFDTVTGETNLISVPRDTQVFMPDSMMLDMKNDDRGDYIPTKYGVTGECKLTEVYAYAGSKNNEYLVTILENLLNVDIDHYVAINLDAFKEIVDAVGGVDMNVPADMYWDMRDTGGILIDLKKGQQHLDGEHAEQLVRFRKGYAQQDIDRIGVQHDFILALADKIFDSDNVLSDLTSLVTTVYKYVNTDISLADCLTYLKYVSLIDTTKIAMETIPGEAQNMYIPDKDGIAKMSDRVFRGIEPDISENTESINDSKHYTIEVSNGGFADGFASKTQERLNALGYSVTTISSWKGDKNENTVIYVKEEGVGDDLIALFSNAEIVVDASAVDGGTDIKIVTGINEI